MLEVWQTFNQGTAVMTKRAKIVLAAVAAALLLGGLAWWATKAPTGDNRADVGSPMAFAMADCKPRLFDGAPA